MRALLIDEGLNRATLVGAKGLVHDGWTVGCAASIPSLASRSRSCSEFHLIASLRDDPERFCADVAKTIAEGRYDVVFPTWEAATSALSSAREQLPGVFPFPAHEVVLTSFDKYALSEIAQASGIASPATTHASDQTLSSFRYPALVKPASHADAYFPALVVDGPDAARARAREIEAAGGSPPLLQEHVQGALVAVAFVADRDGRLLSVSQQRAELVWPPQTGITARGVTEPIDPDLLERVTDFVGRVGWWGLAQLQFLRGPDGVERLIDFNGRYYGSMALALRAGVNHPATWARVALGMPVAQTTQITGVRYQWLTRDLRASAKSTHPVRELLRALLRAPRSAHSLFSPSEPWLAPRFLAEQLRRSIQRRLRSA
jgi:predicted ATP-grasp superfamily ATP-dependent carboligase